MTNPTQIPNNTIREVAWNAGVLKQFTIPGFFGLELTGTDKQVEFTASVITKWAEKLDRVMPDYPADGLGELLRAMPLDCSWWLDNRKWILHQTLPGTLEMAAKQGVIDIPTIQDIITRYGI
jgi:hypothetical protein